MKLKKVISLLISLIFLSTCANYKIEKTDHEKEKIYYSSKGFALIYEDDLYNKKVVNKKINNDRLEILHNLLKKNTPIKIINPDNSKFVETKVFRNAKYPKIFNIIISKKIASILDLDINNPYIEIIEVKKNKTFIAKEGNIFEEEKNVAEKAPVNEVKMDDLSKDRNKNKDTKKTDKEKNKKFIIVISNFYYAYSANNLKKELNKSINNANFSVKKINVNKYRLSVGPFKNFNSLKSVYIGLNNLGFEDLNVYRE